MALIQGTITVDSVAQDGTYTATANSVAKVYMDALYTNLVAQASQALPGSPAPTLTNYQKYQIAIGAKNLADSLSVIVPYLQAHAEVPILGLQAVVTSQKLGRIPTPDIPGADIDAPSATVNIPVDLGIGGSSLPVT